MLKTLHIANIDEEYQLEYYNPVGLLFKKHIFLNDDNKILEFDLQEIKRLMFKKERDLKANYLLHTLACFLLVTSTFFPDNSWYRLFGYGFATIILLFAIAKKTYKYKIILLTKHSNYFTVQVNEAYEDDARELLSLTSEKIALD